MQSAAASAAFWGAFGQAEMHTGATSGVAPTDAIRQTANAAATAESSPTASQCSSPTRQSPRRRLSGLFSKLALLAVVALAAVPSAAACSHGEAQRRTLEQHSATRRLQQAAGAPTGTPTAASGYPSVDYETAKRLAEANNVAAQPQGRRSLSAPRTCAYDDDAEASADAEVRGVYNERCRAATDFQAACRWMYAVEVLSTDAQSDTLSDRWSCRQMCVLGCCQPDIKVYCSD